ncbi:IS5 family transposase [Synechococcus sp. CBW1006]|uniref:IS5 family transposase n=1 Tax=Synechococcus sp. CBW1006 TaxID=1353138 RepID=UPI0018CF358D|nr:IS5 family transposase [Synechococcus sp. CBW1006]QPN67090.1 IS5 family transposase [Synechococcus sp. CBW1006]QPN67130.1 IS5 family transposase [Synechococcus sp. CBW1006]
MYRRHNNGQISIKEFHLPFGGTLDPENRWVQLEGLIPWDELEETYAPQFSATIGAPAKSVRMAFGALYIKQKLGLTDEETVHQIRENAYIQFFLGFAGYTAKAPFDASMMVHFRKRFSDEDLRLINELVVQRGKEILLEALAQAADDDDHDDRDSSGGGAQLELDALIKPADWPEGKNWGTLTIDASCTPADITYPRDLKLLNEARTTTERVIDDLCSQSSGFRRHRPRYDRGLARAHFLRVAKQKRPRRRKVKAAIKHQLGYVRQNLKAIDALIGCGARLSELKRHWWQKLLACSELERQQGLLLASQTNSIPDRLVNLVQTHIRPMVRGKARAAVEFGAKISVSVQNGFPFLHRISWNPYNEGEDLIAQAEKYKLDTGSYPERICADRIYITAKNRHFCTRNGIRLSGKRLGRPPKDPDVTTAHKHQLRSDQARRNEVEGVFGSGKRKYSLDLIMARLPAGAESSISMAFVVMCAEKVLRLLRLFFVLLFGWIYSFFMAWSAIRAPEGICKPCF